LKCTLCAKKILPPRLGVSKNEKYNALPYTKLLMLVGTIEFLNDVYRVRNIFEVLHLRPQSLLIIKVKNGKYKYKLYGET
jgi:hypothetical protein